MDNNRYLTWNRKVKLMLLISGKRLNMKYIAGVLQYFLLKKYMLGRKIRGEMCVLFLYIVLVYVK